MWLALDRAERVVFHAATLGQLPNWSPVSMLLVQLAKAVAVFLAWAVCGHSNARRPMHRMGLSGRGFALRESLRGATVGLCAVGAALAVGWTMDVVRIESWAPRASPSVFGGAVVTAALVACVEEFAFRGFLFAAISEAWSRKVAVAVTLVLFSLAHFPGPEPAPQRAQLAFAIGLSLGVPATLALLRTQRLWWPIGFHFTWDLVLFLWTDLGDQVGLSLVRAASTSTNTRTMLACIAGACALLFSQATQLIEKRAD